MKFIVSQHIADWLKSLGVNTSNFIISKPLPHLDAFPIGMTEEVLRQAKKKRKQKKKK